MATVRIAVVAGPEPGHAFPAIALCLRLRDAGDEPVLMTGRIVSMLHALPESR